MKSMFNYAFLCAFVVNIKGEDSLLSASHANFTSHSNLTNICTSCYKAHVTCSDPDFNNSKFEKHLHYCDKCNINKKIVLNMYCNYCRNIYPCLIDTGCFHCIDCE